MVDKNWLWAEVQHKLKGKLSPAAYQTWFGQTELKRVEEGGEAVKLEILVRDTFSQEQLSGRYQNLLESLFEETLGKKSSLSISAKPRSVTLKPAPLFETPDNKKVSSSPILNPSMSFERFIVGNSNQLAYAACQAVVNALGETYNPLYIYGPTAVGKTHLLQAVGNELSGRAGLTIIYTTCEAFTNEFVESIAKKRTLAFREKYRNVDCLLLDDVQFLSGRHGLQEEFFHTFNALHAHKKQVILTSDRHPTEIGSLEERLVSRFLGGLACDISQPDTELKTAILISKAQDAGLSIDSMLAEKIARDCQNIREVEGALLRLSSLELIEVDAVTGPDSSGRFGAKPNGKGAPSSKRVISAVCRFYGIKTADVLGSQKKRSLSIPRQIIMYLLRYELGLPYTLIGDLLGRKDHTTIIHGVKNVDRLSQRFERVKFEVSQIRQNLFS